MNEKMKKDPLSIEDTANLLGASKVEKIDNFLLDPISMKFTATKVAEKVVNERENSTDKSICKK